MDYRTEQAGGLALAYTAYIIAELITNLLINKI